jgi:hypothetical protein
MKYFSIAIICIITGVVVLTLFIVGSPVEVRMRQLDTQRVSDLGAIQYQLIYYWQTKEMLPEKLSDLTDTISGFRAPRDPEFGTDYEYEKKADTSFVICGKFSRASSEVDKVTTPYYPMSTPLSPSILPSPDFIKGGVDTQWNWAHGVGRSCFERTIDKDRYPSLKPVK